VIEAEFGEPLESRFAWVDPVALAAASIGQVHRAQLKGSAEILAQDVVIKVQRPNIEAIVHTDLSAIQVVSRWIQLYRPLGKRVNVPALVNEFSASLLEEIDYLHEGKNAETFAPISPRPLVRSARSSGRSPPAGAYLEEMHVDQVQTITRNRCSRHQPYRSGQPHV
jgi:hypothetical protein